MKSQVPPAHYRPTEYDTKQRCFSYVEQIAETMRLAPKRVVEVGIGNGFLTRALRAYDVQVTTVDFDGSLRPDVVASVDALPLPSGFADVSLCFEVLEHLPFDRFSTALSELARVTCEWVFISVPDCRSSIRFELARGWQAPAAIRGMLNGYPLQRPKPHVFDGQHYWEIGKAETPVSRVIEGIGRAGLELIRHYRLHLNPYHHFFLMRKVR